MKKLLALLFSASMLLATTSQNEIFLKKIDETFDSSSPLMTSTYNPSTGKSSVTTQTRENYPLWLNIKTLDNVENNSSQRTVKEKMDKLVVQYLKCDEIFSKEALQLLKKKNYGALKYNEFFQRLYPYLSYLEKHDSKDENKKLLDRLLHKALKDSTMLMKNSEDFLDYMVSVNMIKNLYGAFSNLNNYKDIFQEHPVPSSKLFFKKLELDKQNILKMWTDTEQKEFTEVSLSKETMQKIKDATTKKFKTILDTSYEKAKVAILDDSEKSMNAYEEYVLSVQKVENPTWEQIKFKASVYKVKVFDILGIENDNFGNIPDVMTILLAKLLIPYIDAYKKAYTEHQELEQIQSQLNI